MQLNDITRRLLMQITAAMGGAAALPRMALSQDGRTLKIRANRDVQVLDPGWMVGGNETWLQWACLTQLANIKPGNEWGWVPGPLVEEIGNTDAMNIHFKLKPGFQWSGGYGEVTAEDVKYSFERIRHSEWKDKWAVLDHVEITGTHEGVLVLNKPFAAIWLTTMIDGTGSLVCKKAIEEKGHEVDSSQGDGTKVKRYDAEFPAMCGPYVVLNWIPKQRTELGINPDWIGEKPTIERIDLVVVEDDKAAELGFEAGDLDMTVVSVDSVPRYTADPLPETEMVNVPGLLWTWMGMNTEHPKLQDHRVREAICWAVDVESILQGAYAGIAPRSFGIVPPGLIGHRDTYRFANRDVEKAKALIAEAGAEGLELDIKIINKTDQNTAASIIQANLAEIGINLTVTPLESGVWWDLGLESRGEAWKDLQLYISRYGDAPDPSQMVQWYVSGQVGIWNWERWKNPEFDALFDQGLGETDVAKRNEMYIRMQELMDDTAAYVYITHEPYNIIHRTNFKPVISLNGDYLMTRFTWV